MSASLALGVIGHVDHGKTRLVRALTGIRTDRLAEERTRGLSIVLGFAYLETPSGVVDVIDVPGHEDFVRAMISGATGLDAVVLVIAANEGVMPQTREHFDIAMLLGVERGLVVLTKCDLVDAERKHAVRAEIAAFLAGSFLEGAPVIETALTERAPAPDEADESDARPNVEAVRDALGHLLATARPRLAGPRFYLPLDRVFTLRGFGTIGTGTLRAGAIRAGERIAILPTGHEATVRGLQSRNLPIDEAHPGQRVAVNLRGVDRAELKRGYTLATPGFLLPTRRLDVEIELLASATPLRNGMAVRILLGTQEVIARLRLLDRKELNPGETGLIQLRCDREIATHAPERFIVRSYSPMITVGGGRVLDTQPERHRRFDPTVTERLLTLASGDLARIVEDRLRVAGGRGLDARALALELGIPEEALDSIFDALEVVEIGEHRVIDATRLNALLGEIEEGLRRLHEKEPLKVGLPATSAASLSAAPPDPDVLRYAVDRLVSEGIVDLRAGMLSLHGFDPFATLEPAQRRLLVRMERLYREAGYAALPLETVVGRDEARRRVFRLLLESGRLVQLRTYDRGTERVLHADAVHQAQRLIASRFPYPEQFALKDVRDLLGSTRKHVVPLMEHFDATGVTTRNGDMRLLRTG